jgi:hypothetical protein
VLSCNNYQFHKCALGFPAKVFLSRVGELREAARLNLKKKQQENSKRLVDLLHRIVRDLRPGELVLVRRKLKKFLPKYKYFDYTPSSTQTLWQNCYGLVLQSL